MRLRLREQRRTAKWERGRTAFGRLLGATGTVVLAGWLATWCGHLLAQGLSPTTPAKEHIRVGGRIVAIETSGIDYLVGDADPLTSTRGDLNGDGDRYDAGEFGNELINAWDVTNTLRAVTNIPGYRPPACSDRFDAIDSHPPDSSTARGGDGALTNLDITITNQRSSGADTSRPRRQSRGLVCTAGLALPMNRSNDEFTALGGGMGLEVEVSSNEAAGSQSAGATNAIPLGGAIVPGTPRPAPGGKVRVPITLKLNDEVTVESVSFGLQVLANGAPPLYGTLAFEKDRLLPPPTLLDTGAGSDLISVAWLSLSPTLTGTVQLGDIVVAIPAKAARGQTYTVRILGASSHLQKTAVELAAGTDSNITVGTGP